NEGRVAEKQRAELLGSLEAEALHLRGDNREAPLAPEVLLRRRTARRRRILSTTADDHEVRPGSVPQRTIVEHVTEGPEDCLSADVAEIRERQPVGDDPLIGESIVNELEIFARIQILDASNARGRRLARDQIEVPIRRLQKIAAVFDVDVHPRITKR